MGVLGPGRNVAAMANSDVLSIEHDGDVATLWLDRPEPRNAMGPAFWDDLRSQHLLHPDAPTPGSAGAAF